jgi:hypothetical protein
MFERQMKSESWGLELMWGGKNHKKNDEEEAATQKKRRCPPEDACDIHVMFIPKHS